MLTTIPQLHMQHFNIAQVNHRARVRHAFTSILKNPDFNNHVYLENVSLRNNGIFWLDKKNHAGGGRETGNQFGVA